MARKKRDDGLSEAETGLICDLLILAERGNWDWVMPEPIPAEIYAFLSRARPGQLETVLADTIYNLRAGKKK